MHKYAKTNQEDTIYSTFEMGFIRKANKIKIFFLNPVVKFLDKVGISANMVSIFSAVVAVVGLALSYLTKDVVYFAVGIWIHLLLDCADGTLARYQHSNSSKGAFIDVFCDHAGVISASIFAYLFMMVDLIDISLFVFMYSVLMSIILYLLKNHSSYKFVIRPRFYFYVAITIDIFFSQQITSVTILIANIVMLIEIVVGILKILSIKKMRFLN
ncbi:CDP-alcohol phosphatidyltransferase family protein [bacterium]|nr:CDP-alcohol phosphatidyltransferase family protein [bacterium]